MTAIHYNRRKVSIRAVLTHEAYDQNTWKEYAMLQKDMGHAVQAWHALEAIVYVPHTEEESQRLVAF